MAQLCFFFYTDIRSNHRAKEKRGEHNMKWVKKCFKFMILFLFMICFFAAGILSFSGIKTANEKLSQKSLYEMAHSIENKDDFVSYDDLPDMYCKAVIAAEDKRFFKHCGIDLIAIGRAVVHDLAAGSYVEGGSTITQQLAKNQYLTQEKLLERKAAEMFLAFEIEKVFSKEEIFALYVNSIYFGSGYYGIAEASRGYYGKEVWDLTDEECVTLAGIPNAPSVYDLNQNPDLAEQRKDQVLRQMSKLGDIVIP